MEGLEKRLENRYTLAGSPSHLSREPLNNSIVAGPYLNQNQADTPPLFLDPIIHRTVQQRCIKERVRCRVNG